MTNDRLATAPSKSSTAIRRGLAGALRTSMPRNEFFAALFILGCANGLGARVIGAVNQSGWSDAILGTFGVSAIVWIACFAGVSLILRNDTEEMRTADLLVGTGFLILVILPTGLLSWLAVAALSLYILVFASGPAARRRGAIILLAITVPMLWSRLLFHFFANTLLEIDARLIAWLLGTQRNGTLVQFSDSSNYLVILPECASLENLSLAFLCWVTITQLAQHRWVPQDILWCVLVCASAVAVNVVRVSLMGLSEWHYQVIHGQVGAAVASVVILGLAVGLSMLGVRRELFPRI